MLKIRCKLVCIVVYRVSIYANYKIARITALLKVGHKYLLVYTFSMRFN
jgi:hypothetical protein